MDEAGRAYSEDEGAGVSADDMMERFMEACDDKHRRGVREHRPDGGGFQGDPMLEYQQEQIDSANYLGVMLSDGVISDEEFRLGYKNAFEAWWWIETKRERQGG